MFENNNDSDAYYLLQSAILEMPNDEMTLQKQPHIFVFEIDI